MKKDVEIYMCDDNKEYLSYAQEEVKSIAGQERNLTFTVFNNGEEMIKKCKTHCADVLFLDIDMPGMNGFEVAETIQEFYNDVLIIFMTSHDDMVFHSFKYHPFWFVRKSCIEELEIVVPALLKKFDTIYDNMDSIKSIVVNDEVYEFDIKTLKLVYSHKHHVFLIDESGKETQIRTKLQIVENQLSEMFFVRVQKGVIINLRFVVKINSRKVVFKDGSEFNIGRDRLDIVRKEYHRYLRSI